VQGDKIIETTGKMTSERVLPSDGPRPNLETSFENVGTVLGKPVKMLVTYRSTIRADGSIYGECPAQGLIMCEGGAIATFRAAGAGRFTDTEGSVAFRGAIYCETTSEELSALNGLAVIYEWDVDASGNATFSGWEWK